MEELNSGPPKTNLSSGREEDLNPGPPDYKSSALTTRPRCLLDININTNSTFQINLKKGLHKMGIMFQTLNLDRNTALIVGINY